MKSGEQKEKQFKSQEQKTIVPHNSQVVQYVLVYISMNMFYENLNIC